MENNHVHSTQLTKHSDIEQIERKLSEATQLLRSINNSSASNQHHRRDSSITPSSPAEKKTIWNQIVVELELTKSQLLVVAKERDRATNQLVAVNKHLNQVRQGVTTMKVEMDTKLNHFLDELHQLEAAVQNCMKQANSEEHGPHQLRTTKQKSGKVFVSRESRLTELLQIRDIRTLYNFFVALLLLLGVSVIVQNFLENESPLDFGVLKFAFGKFDQAVVAWCVATTYFIVSFLWKPIVQRMGKSSLLPYAIIQCSFLTAFGLTALHLHLPPASGFFLLAEVTRIAMKVHSFYRHVLDAAHAFNSTDPSNQESSQESDAKDSDHDQDPQAKRRKRAHPVTFQHYLYFFLAPTLLFKPVYPRTHRIRWLLVFQNFTEVVLVVMYTYAVFERFCVPTFRGWDSRDRSWRTLALNIIHSMLPGTAVFVFGFFGLLHCWLNAWSELLCFADREFYRDWWNSSSFAEYYRKWNGVVHDWLYAYVYLDTMRILEGRGFQKATARSLAALVVIEISAIVHEYIITCALGNFFPILLIMFGGPGLSFIYMNQRRQHGNPQNIFLWAMLLFGNGSLLVLYCREYYARIDQLDNNHAIWSVPFWQQFVRIYSL